MKLHTKTTLLSLALVFALMVLAGASCGVTTEDDTANTNAAANTNEATAADSQWTSSTSQGSIADTPMAGTINGEEVTILDVQITDWDEYFSWEFSDTAVAEACDVETDNSAVSFDTDELTVGTYEKTMTEEETGEYYAYYYYQQEDGTPMSVNTSWAATVVVSEIDETNNKVSGWAKFEFDDGLTVIEGSFEADICEW